jgi:uncharacterized Zn-binding protein involved in type VI secretion
MWTGLVPHVGGPILPPGAPTVMLGGMPAARVTDPAVCAGGPDMIALGSFVTMFGGMPAAYMGSLTVHGGVVVMGFPLAMIN